HVLCFQCSSHPLSLHSFPTRRSSDLVRHTRWFTSTDRTTIIHIARSVTGPRLTVWKTGGIRSSALAIAMTGTKYWLRTRTFLERSEEHTSELQSRENLVCRLLLEKKK